MKYVKLAGVFIAGIFIFSVMSMNGYAEQTAVNTTKKAVSKKQEVKKEPVSSKKSAIQATFVELGSVNCIPCKAMKPVMTEIENEYGGRVNVVFYDVWKKEGEPYAEKYQIRAIPTQVFLDKDGKEFFRHTGFFPKEEIVKVLDKQGIKKPAAAGNESSDNNQKQINIKDGVVCK